jgi:hypothetical protein
MCFNLEEMDTLQIYVHICRERIWTHGILIFNKQIYPRGYRYNPFPQHEIPPIRSNKETKMNKLNT